MIGLATTKSLAFPLYHPINFTLYTYASIKRQHGNDCASAAKGHLKAEVTAAWSFKGGLLIKV
jgi:hypothetical protein